jgi:hypothetical protein
MTFTFKIAACMDSICPMCDALVSGQHLIYVIFQSATFLLFSLAGVAGNSDSEPLDSSNISARVYNAPNGYRARGFSACMLNGVKDLVFSFSSF